MTLHFKKLLLGLVIIVLANTNCWALEINPDGRTLIQEASLAYASDMKGRPVVTEPVINEYLSSIARKLAPADKKPPPGVSLSVTVIESPQPEIYAYMDGHIVMTSGMIFSMENEAQLGGILSHQVAHVTEGYYISMYQEIKAAERKQRRKAIAGALFGALLDVAVDYAVEMDEINQAERYLEGEATYSETMKRLITVQAAQSTYYSIKDVIASIPAHDSGGSRIDPRLRFEPVADAQGMVYLAQAGYAVAEAPKGWHNIHRINSKLAREQEQLMGPWADQMRSMRGLMELNMNRLRQHLGASGLVQTISNVPPSRSQFVAKLTRMEEVKAAEKSSPKTRGEKSYQTFVKQVLLPRAEQALKEEQFERAYQDYRLLYNSGVKTAPVTYGLGKSKLGDFAFGASPAELKEAEARYKEAARLDPTFALPHKGLAELYEDSERYAKAAKAYQQYLQLSPDAADRKRIKRKIKVLQRKANR